MNGSVTINASDVNNGSFDNWGIKSISLNKTTFDCSDIGENTVTLTVVDKAGNIDSATAIVTIIGAIPAPAITLSRSDNTYTGLPDNTIALGYGAQSLIFSATDSTSANGSTNYVWSPSTGLSSTNTATTTFSATTAGTYTFTLLATNEFGCTSSASVTVTVIDARCGNKKVVICKNSGNGSNQHQICVSPNAVPAHLNNGGSLGSCSGGSVSAQINNESSSELDEASVLVAHPNPFDTQTTLTFHLNEAENQVTLDIYDLIGNKLKAVYAGSAAANKTYSFPVNMSSFQGDVFVVRLVTPNKAYNFKLLKEKK